MASDGSSIAMGDTAVALRSTGIVRVLADAAVPFMRGSRRSSACGSAAR